MVQGCVVTEHLAKDKIHIEADPMEPARASLRSNDYNRALMAYSEILKQYPQKTPGDKALFGMGTLFAYPDNPKRDISKANGYFKRLVKEFPESPLKKEALAWVDVLNRISENEGRIKELLEKNRAFQEQINALEKKNSTYEEQIRALKEIDIGIEEEKRQEAPEK